MTVTPSVSTTLALIAGVANAAAFAPFAWWPLSPLSLAVLFALWLNATPAAAARIGFAFGVGLFGAGASWMYVSLNTFGGMPAPLAAFCILILTLTVSLFPAAAGALQSLFLQRARVARLTLIMPAAWLLIEWLRGWLLTGYPWLTTGYAFTDTVAAGLAPLGGVHLVGLLSLVTVGATVALLINVTRESLIAAVTVAVAWLGAWQAQKIIWTQPLDKKITVAVVQNNVPLMAKWDAAERNRIVGDYLAVSDRHRDADLVVWPEAAAPDYLDRLPQDFYRRLRAHPADFIFGVLTRAQVDSGRVYYFNSIAAVGDGDGDDGDDDGDGADDGDGHGDDDGDGVDHRDGVDADHDIALYHKQHLVPFGEFLPLKFLFAPLVSWLQIPMSDFTAWQRPQPPLAAAGVTFAASLCYEDAFPNEWRAQVAASGALINLSEDIWFGDSLAPHQRLQMARFRATESARPMVRASNNGLSSVINWRGGVVTVAPQFKRAVVTATLQPRAGVTPYTRFGDAPALALAVALWLVGLLFGRRRLR